MSQFHSYCSLSFPLSRSLSLFLCCCVNLLPSPFFLVSKEVWCSCTWPVALRELPRWLKGRLHWQVDESDNRTHRGRKEGGGQPGERQQVENKCKRRRLLLVLLLLLLKATPEATRTLDGLLRWPDSHNTLQLRVKVTDDGWYSDRGEEQERKTGGRRGQGSSHRLRLQRSP